MKIGYLASDLITSYNCTIWNGIREVCADSNVTFLYFSAGVLQSPDINQSTRNRISDLVNKNNIDGLIVNSSTIFHYLTIAEISDFYKKFGDLPIVNIGVKFRHYPTVTNDNANGMKEIVTHLLDIHSYRRIAFISGPKNNFDSNVRLHTLRKTLELYGIGFNEKLLAEGDFYMQSGINAMDKLLKTGISFDAAVCLSDDMAIGAIMKAQENNIIIPNEMAITGFDNIAESSKISIPLTTVIQPIKKQAREASKLLINLIKTGKAEETYILPTSLKIRKSCGCLSAACRHASMIDLTTKTEIKNGKYTSYLEDNKKEIVNKLPSEIKTEESEHAGQVLICSLARYIREGGQEAALFDVDLLLNTAIIHSNQNFPHWQDLISELMKSTLLNIEPDCTEYKLSQSFWQQVRIMVHEMNMNLLSFEKLERDLAYFKFGEVNGRLVSSFKINELIETIRRELPKIDVKACYICLFEDSEEKTENSVRLILAYNSEGDIPLPDNGILFSGKDLIPHEMVTFKPSDFFIVEALFFEQELFGYALFQTNPQRVLFEELRQQISSAMKGALLSEEVQSLLKNQKTHLDRLEKANKIMKENQEKILAIEKMIVMDKLTSLSRLTAGLAHELNTPLASIRASSMEIDTLIEEYRQSAGDREVTPEDHLGISSDMSAINTLIRKAAEKAVGFVQGMKMQTREPEKVEKNHFNPLPTINDAILLLNHTLRKHDCRINFFKPDIPMDIFGNEARFSQVITNLIVNAVDASKEAVDKEITINAQNDGKNIIIIVSDKGSGIDPEIVDKIFDPMFTTKSVNEGTGLGLTIVHNIITGDFDGTINVNSTPGRGTAFTIKIPVEQPGDSHG